MVGFSPLAMTVLMGVLLAAVLFGVTRSRSQHPSMLARRAAGGGLSTDNATPFVDRFVDSTLSWVVSFVLITFGVLGAILVMLTSEGTAVGALLATGAVVLLGIVTGTFVLARSSGMKNAWATMVTASVVGVLLVVGVSVTLLIG